MRIFSNKHFKLLYFLVCFVALFLIYFTAHRAMLIDDGISGIWEIKMQGLKGYWKSYGFQNFYYGHYGILALLYFIFGLNAMGWYLFFVLMHALNATLLFVICKKIFSNTGNEIQSALMGLFSSLLFLLSPYQSENIIWAATSHYNVTLCILLGLLIFLIQKMEGKRGMSLILSHLLFVLSLVTLEISFLFPFVLTATFLLYRGFRKTQMTMSLFFRMYLLPQMAAIFIYCLLHKICFHTWIPHDRAGQDTVFSLSHAVTTLSQQMTKLFGFVHFLPYHQRDMVYSALLHWKKVLLILILISVIVSFLLYKKSKPHLYAAWFMMSGAIMMYAPFMRLYFMYLARLENDRYNYFASAFLFPLFVFLLFQLHRSIRYTLIAVYLLAFLVCLFPVVSARKHSAVLHREYLSQLPAANVPGKIYLLNVPASCRDAYMFRAEGRLGIAYQVLYDKNIFDKVVQIAWYNARGERDHFEARKVTDSSFQVQIKTDGSWWMYQSIGASDRETDDYRFELKEWGAYLLTFRHTLSESDRVLLYTDGKFESVRQEGP